jgi:hypothetical protein
VKIWRESSAIERYRKLSPDSLKKGTRKAHKDDYGQSETINQIMAKSPTIQGFENQAFRAENI